MKDAEPKLIADEVLLLYTTILSLIYRGADKSLARPTSQCILFDDENISFDASLVGRFHPFTGHEGP